VLRANFTSFRAIKVEEKTVAQELTITSPIKDLELEIEECNKDDISIIPTNVF
jgi:hypothetical protein